MIVSVLLPQQTSAQAPEQMSYQAVIRNSSEQLVTSQAVGMQISILQSSASGTTVYVETQTPTSNANGLVSIGIGSGTVVSGDFITIDWANGPYFIKTETDPSIPSATHTSEMLHWGGSVRVTIASGSGGAVLALVNGVPTWVVAAQNVTNPTTDKLWMDRNLGASQVAASSTDSDAYGDLYQ